MRRYALLATLLTGLSWGTGIVYAQYAPTITPLWQDDYHTGGILATAMNADGSLFATGAIDNTIRLWNTATGEMVRTFEEHRNAVTSVAIDSDAKLLVSGGFDSTVKVWNLQTGELLRTLIGHTNTVHAVAISPDGATILSGDADETIRAWNAADGSPIRSYTNDKNIHFIAFRPDGLTFFAGGRTTFGEWSLSDTSIVRRVWNSGGTCNSGAVSGNGQRLVTCSAAAIDIFDLSTGGVLLVRTINAPDHGVQGVAITADGATIATAGSDNTVKFWNANDGSLIRSLTGPIDPRAMAMTPDGQMIVATGIDNTIRVWNASDGALRYLIGGHRRGVARIDVSPDGTMYASGSVDGAMNLRSLANDSLVRIVHAHAGEIVGLSFTPDGDSIVTASADWLIRIWDSGTGDELNSLSGHMGAISDATVVPDGSAIVSTGHDNAVRVWPLPTGLPSYTLLGYQGDLTAVSVTPDGATALVGGYELIGGVEQHIVRLWNLTNRTVLSTIPSPAAGIRRLCTSPDGTRFAAVFYNSELSPPGYQIGLWQVASGTLDLTLTGHSGDITSAMFSTNGSIVLSGSLDGTVRLWTANAGDELLSIDTEQGGVRSLALSPDGAMLLTGGADGTVKRWTIDPPFSQIPVAIRTPTTALPERVALYPARPNPFNPSTTIRYALPTGGVARLDVFSITGQKVRTLFSGPRAAGSHNVLWDGTGDTGVPVGSGVYIVVLRAEDVHSVQRVTLIR